MLNNFKREDLSKIINSKKGFSVLYSKKLIGDVIEILCQEIKNDYLNLKNLGTFKTIFKQERLGRNPKTKIIYKINSRKSVSFVPSKNLLKKINKINE